ncbi:MAG: hypothetical protein NC432_08710 [Roseburia sp.]|nr:hypothetical protein [Roseburia sp.]MCM1097806.1 hypothetical protein [Ruminococcus flavefaciens]
MKREISLGRNTRTKNWNKRGKIRNVKPGDRLRLRDPIRTVHDSGTVFQDYCVREIYPYFALAENLRTGELRGIPYGELILLGLERQEPRLEALRLEENGKAWRKGREGDGEDES